MPDHLVVAFTVAGEALGKEVGELVAATLALDEYLASFEPLVPERILDSDVHPVHLRTTAVTNDVALVVAAELPKQVLPLLASGGRRPAT